MRGDGPAGTPSPAVPIVPGRLAATELLDRDGHDPNELAANLADIRRVNRLGGGTRVVLRHLRELVEPIPWERPVDVLDLGCGSGDIPLAVAAWLRRRNREARVIAADASAEVLAIARHQVGERPEIALARFDARNVALPDRAVDVVLCSLTLHHLDPEDAVRLLREMRRLARVGFIVNDVERSAAGFAVAWAASRLGTRNRLTRHDMPLSVRRAYTVDEVRELLAEAGIAEATVARHPLFRLTVVWKRPAD